MAQNRIEYRIVGRFAKDEKAHVVDWSWRWTKEDAERRLNELKAEEERAKKRGEHVSTAGMFSVSTPYYSEYALCDLRIQTREVSPWTNVEE